MSFSSWGKKMDDVQNVVERLRGEVGKVREEQMSDQATMRAHLVECSARADRFEEAIRDTMGKIDALSTRIVQWLTALLAMTAGVAGFLIWFLLTHRITI